jgi:ribose transport system ATP-binding protein
LHEVEQCANRVVVLRDGQLAGNLARGEINHQSMIKLMVGRELKDLYVREIARQETPGAAAIVLEVKGLRTRQNPKHEVSFNLARGEILGFAGLVGAGRSEMAQAIFGVDPPLQGTLALEGVPLRIRCPEDAIRAGIYLVPEDRRRTGLVTEMTVRENITLPGLRELAACGWIRRRAENEVAARQAESLRVKTPSLEAQVLNLSGGNQQKVVLAKWLALRPRVLLFDEPTRGIDVGAKAEIYRLMRDLADSGVGIIMISSEMEEVIGVSDRIAVMHEGALSGVLERPQFSEERIMSLAVGKALVA